MTITVKDCFIYPLKSAQAVRIEEIAVDARGLKNDRLYMVVDEDGNFITQRQNKILAKISTALTPDEKLALSFDTEESMIVSKSELSATTMPVKVWKDECPAHIAPRNINEWFSSILECPAKLVRLSDGHPRQTDLTFSQQGDQVSFADGFPLLITTTASLDALMPHFSDEITMDRFRPNIVFEGNEAFAEDVWFRIKVGEVELELVKHCDRCVMITIDQTTGKKTSSEPITTLKKLRKGKSGVYFGDNAIPRKTGLIKVGDNVEILETRPLSKILENTALNALKTAL